MKFISIVSGCFNEVENIPDLVARVAAAMKQLPNYEYEQIIIDNNSTDGTPKLLRQIARENPHVKIILNARNFGHIRSPYYGMLQGAGEAIVYLASDLQEPPELIPEMMQKWEEGAKAVVCVKKSSEETPLFFLLRRLCYYLLGRFSEVSIIQNFTGFGLYDRSVIEHCREMGDSYPFFRGMISEIGLPIAEIPYRQPLRKRGFTKNNFYTLYDMAMLGMTSHSKVPLRLAILAGFLMALVSFLMGLGYLVYKLLFWNSFSLGTAPMVIGLFLFASVQLLFIGVLGEYIGAIHTQVLKRPLVVEKERINFEQAS
jgi:glycosyltransferase involved in cell wall biosynthesis